LIALRVLRALAPFAACILAACAVAPPASEPGVRSWAGRFSLIATGPAKVDSWSGRYALQLRAGLATLDLSSPLGATLARCHWGGSAGAPARIEVPDGAGLRTEVGHDPQELTQRILGWPLPLARLPDWIDGRPGGETPVEWKTREAALQEFSQDGWSVHIERAAAGAAPRRMDLVRDPALPDQPRVRLRVLPDAS
jgi:outer membrane biogenesis lipoprotein LolB